MKAYSAELINNINIPKLSEYSYYSGNFSDPITIPLQVGDWGVDGDTNFIVLTKVYTGIYVDKQYVVYRKPR